MAGLAIPAPVALRDFSACSGCSLCLLVCPMWRSRRDPRFSAEGLAKGLQCGATAADLAATVDACSLCGACDPVCPERIDLSGMIMELRRQQAGSLPNTAAIGELCARLQQDAATDTQATSLLLPGPELRSEPALLAQVRELLGLAISDDDGDDIALALELGVPIPPSRLQSFLAPLSGRSIVAADGLLLRQLRRWLPGSKRMGMGAALSSRAAVRTHLSAADLYVIEPRACHADYERMVAYYNHLQRETGCLLSMDLQRIAIPAMERGLRRVLGEEVGADDTPAQWILQGRTPSRIVVESLADRAAFRRICDIPVLHVAELGEDPTMIRKTARAFS